MSRRDCKKRPYGSYRQAIRALRTIRARADLRHRDRHGLPIRTYSCPSCGGWHLTSTPQHRKKHA